MAKVSGQVLVLTAFGHGHLFPCIELCNNIASRNYKTTLLVFSHLLPSINHEFTQNPLVEVVEVESPSPRPGLPVGLQIDTYTRLCRVLETILSAADLVRPVCAVVNVFMLMGWTKEVFRKFRVPTVGFFTSGACSPAMEYGAWKANPRDIREDEIRLMPGLPEEMGLTRLNIKRRPFAKGPPGPGERPDWLDDVEDAVGLMFNTCDNLERPFLEYLACQLDKPAWGVGPLVPLQYWKPYPVSDRAVRVSRESNVTEHALVEWLDTKPRGSVIYISFGSSVSLTIEEYGELGDALVETTRPFIWVIQPSPGGSGYYYPEGLDEKVGSRGLIISGWAPQLLILSHPSTGGFLSHCGWNSTLESLMQGVPLLTCPIRGDQYDNARLVVDHFNVGYAVMTDPSCYAKKSDFCKGIEELMRSDEITNRGKGLRDRFGNGFPSSSNLGFNALFDRIGRENCE